MPASKSPTPRTHVRQFRGISMPLSSHPAIRRLKRADEQPAIHGNKLWRSSLLLIDYLHRNPPARGLRVLDVGCGWGLISTYCARQFDAQVTSVDADAGVFPYLQTVAALNQVQVTTWQRRFEQLSKRDLAGFDLLVGADICFWDELAAGVGRLVHRAINAGVGKIVIADPERPPFHSMAESVLARHGGELLPRRLSRPVTASGALLIIENA